MPSTSPDRGQPGHGVPALRARLAPVLADLTFPARRWQAVAVADLYGCDGVTRALVDRLPERTYASFGELAAVLDAVLAGHGAPAPSPAARAAVPPARSGGSGTRPVPGVPGAGTAAPAPGSLGARPRVARRPVVPARTRPGA